MKIKIILLFGLMLWTALFAFSVYRDIQMVNQDGFGDLRNRVVGARLIEDGKSPYWYKWQIKDGTRYYDRWNIVPLKVNNITASPLFLHLMRPVADISQDKLSRYWLFAEYFIYFLIVLMAFLLPDFSSGQKKILLVPILLFFLTVPWVAHTSVGQNYLFIPFLLLAFFLFFQGKSNYFIRGFCCGALAVTAILVRPFLVLFFIPYLFRWKQLNRHFMMAAVLPLLITGAWLLADKQEQLYWKDYNASITEQVKYHQALNPTPAQIDTPPAYVAIEGVNLQKSIYFRPEMKKRGIVLQFQTASVYKNFAAIFHRSIPVSWLAAMGAGTCTLLLLAYWLRRRQEIKTNIPSAALIGFCLYFIADIFSPVYRGEYSAVAWLFPIAVLPSFYRAYLKYPYLLFFAGLAFNVFYFKIYKIQYAIGEYMMFTALLYIVFSRPPHTAQAKTPLETVNNL